MVDPAQLKEWLESPYKPEIGMGVEPLERLAKAAEYSAYHLFEISQKLNKLINETSNVGAMVMMYAPSDDQ